MRKRCSKLRNSQKKEIEILMTWRISTLSSRESIEIWSKNLKINVHKLKNTKRYTLHRLIEKNKQNKSLKIGQNKQKVTQNPYLNDRYTYFWHCKQSLKHVFALFSYQIKLSYYILTLKNFLFLQTSQQFYFLKPKLNKKMWNFKSCSKLTQDRIRQKSYDLHRQKLQRMKSKLKIKQPQQPQFIYTKNKLEMSRRDSLLQIQKHNQLLLGKINFIRQRDNPTLQKQNYGTGSLHKTMFNVLNNTIFSQNKRICEKLLKITPFYKTQQILNKADQLEYVANNISENARRAQSAVSRSKSLMLRPQSGYTNRPKSGMISTSQQKCKKTSSTSLFPSRMSSDIRPQSAPTFKRVRIALNEYNPKRNININDQEQQHNQGKIVINDQGARRISQN